MKITDDMVEAAKKAYFAHYKTRPYDENLSSDSMRVALEAAVLAQPAVFDTLDRD